MPLHTYVSPGVYVVTLVVQDDWPQHSLAVTVEIPVYAPSGNQAPVTDAGEDQTALVGEFIGLQGSAADPDGDPVVDWLWSVESSPAGSRLTGSAASGQGAALATPAASGHRRQPDRRGGAGA